MGIVQDHKTYLLIHIFQSSFEYLLITTLKKNLFGFLGQFRSLFLLFFRVMSRAYKYVNSKCIICVNLVNIMLSVLDAGTGPIGTGRLKIHFLRQS